MKVLYLLSSSSPFGGSSKSFLQMCVKLVECYDIQPHIVLPTQNGIYYDLIQRGIVVSIVPTRYNAYPPFNDIKGFLTLPIKLIYHFLVNKKAKAKIKQIAQDFQPELIHTNVGVVNVGFNVAKELKIKHIYHLREYQTLDLKMKIIPSLKSFKKHIKSPNNHNICITRGIQSYFGLEEANSTVIYNGLTEGRKENVSLFEKDKYFLYVGRLNEQKGIFDVLKAFSLFSRKNETYELFCVGTADSEAGMRKIQDMCKSLNITYRVKFLGWRTDVNILMRQATALLMASKSEAFGRVTVEAMNNGCLVIGNNTAGTKEQFDNGLALLGEEIGIRYNSIEECARRMNEVTENGMCDYSCMIRRAQKVVNRLYSIDSNAKNVYTLYKRLVSEEYLCN